MSQFLSLWPALVLLLVVCLLDRCHGDTPADCSYADIRGTWTFYVGSGGNDNSIDCSGDFKTAEKLTVTLDFPDIATIKGRPEEGFWTLIYNQGFEVAVGGRKFFAFSNYSTSISTSTSTSTSTSMPVSYCYSTLNGWVHDLSGKDWACYRAVKVPSTAYTSGFTVRREDGAHVDLDRRYVRNMGYVHRINHASTGHWQATHYPALEGLTLRQRLMRAGGPMSRPLPPVNAVPAREGAAWEDGAMGAWIQSYFDSLMQSSDVETASNDPAKMELLQDIEETYTQRDIGLGRSLDKSLSDKEHVESSQLAVADLPASLDWRDMGGVNYIPPVRNQGDCGSCYAFSTTAMLSSRFKISSNGSVASLFSPEDVVSCSQYSQGCDGGFPYLVAKYAEDFGMVEESCSPYTDTDTAACPSVGAGGRGCTRYHAHHYQYVGGYYGACSETAMLLELALHGPIVMGYQVEADFMLYKSGVYMHTGLSDEWNPWMVVNHAVLVVGYGEVEGEGIKYWTVQNSWGSMWGEDGYFKIVRGTNEANCESIAVCAKPVLPVPL